MSEPTIRFIVPLWTASARMRPRDEHGGRQVVDSCHAVGVIDDQLQRGRRYRSQLDQFIGFPEVVGAVWHAWNDRFMPADPSLQINLGLVQCADPAHRMRAGQRWTPTDDLIAETNHTILRRIATRTGI